MTHRQRQEGEAAFLDGTHRSANPYDVETNEWIEWMDGFDAAASQKSHPHEVSAPSEHVRVL